MQTNCKISFISVFKRVLNGGTHVVKTLDICGNNISNVLKIYPLYLATRKFSLLSSFFKRSICSTTVNASISSNLIQEEMLEKSTTHKFNHNQDNRTYEVSFS